MPCLPHMHCLPVRSFWMYGLNRRIQTPWIWTRQNYTGIQIGPLHATVPGPYRIQYSMQHAICTPAPGMGNAKTDAASKTTSNERPATSPVYVPQVFCNTYFQKSEDAAMIHALDIFKTGNCSRLLVANTTMFVFSKSQTHTLTCLDMPATYSYIE
jgi:hypothetical protein